MSAELASTPVTSASAAEPRGSVIAGWLRSILSAERFAIFATVMLITAGVAVPLVAMTITSMRPVGVLPFDSDVYTFDSIREAIDALLGNRVLSSTVIFSLGSLAVALTIAYLLAFLTERTDFRFSRQLGVLMFVPMCLPSFAFALAWILLVNPRNGMVNDLLMKIIPGAGGAPLNIYSMYGLVFVQGIAIIPSIWLVLSSILRNHNSSQEDAARTAGAGRWRTFWRITFPTMRPGLGAVVLLYFLVAMQSVEIALALAPNAGVPLLTVRAFFAIQPTGLETPNYAVASAFGLFTVVVGVIGILIYLRLLRHAEHFASVTGRDLQVRKVVLGRLRWLAYGGVIIYLLVAIVLPVGVLVYASLLEYYISPIGPSNGGGIPWTLSSFDYLRDSQYWHMFVNTIMVSAGAAVCTSILSMVVSWAAIRRRSKIAKFGNVVSFVPLAIPNVILSLAFFTAVLGTPLYQTLAILVIAQTVNYLPFSTRLAYAAQLQVSAELEEAARVGGSGSARSFLRINLPLVRASLANQALWVFIHAAKDFSAALILAGVSTELIANGIWNEYAQGNLSGAAALMVSLVVLNVLVLGFGRRRLQGRLLGDPSSAPA